MHPAMALWIWSMAMARAWQTSLEEITGPLKEIGLREVTKSPARLLNLDPRLVPAHEYLHSDIATSPLPGDLLDRLADLYWTERDEEMAV